MDEKGFRLFLKRAGKKEHVVEAEAVGKEAADGGEVGESVGNGEVDSAGRRCKIRNARALGDWGPLQNARDCA